MAKAKSPAPSRASFKPRKRGTVLGSEVVYEDDETEFMRAMDRYKREKRRPFPTLSETLAVLKALGYRKEPKP